MEAYIILEENGKGIFCPKYRFPLSNSQNQMELIFEKLKEPDAKTQSRITHEKSWLSALTL